MIRAVLLCMVALCGSAAAEVILTPEQIKAALAHGPWPPEQTPDPSNRASGDPRAIAMGERLFFDPALSVDGAFSCASCHVPEAAFADGLPRSQGRILADRNTTSVINARFHRWFGWDGSTDNLWAQNLLPIFNTDEMAMTPETVQDLIASPSYVSDYTAIFAEPTAQTATEVSVNSAKLLAAYIETLVSPPAAFDIFRDALERGDLAKAAEYPQEAQRGFALFSGRGNCSFCHSGPMFTNGEFHDAGVPYFTETGVDQGRFRGLKTLLSSPFTLDGDYSDDPAKSGGWAVRGVVQLHSDFGTFRVPSLRGAAQTAPYMHDGSLPDLAAVIEHYNSIDLERLHADGEAILLPLGLTETEAADLKSFLETLSR